MHIASKRRVANGTTKLGFAQASRRETLASIEFVIEAQTSHTLSDVANEDTDDFDMSIGNGLGVLAWDTAKTCALYVCCYAIMRRNEVSSRWIGGINEVLGDFELLVLA